MTSMDCDELEAVAEDLALGLLTGEERAAALAHLEGCPACRSEVASLSAVADELVLLAPSVEPPPGFDGAVLARLAEAGAVPEAEPPAEPAISSEPATVTPLRSATRRRERRTALRAVAAVAAALAFVGVLLFAMGNTPAVAVATMRTPSGRYVGEAYWRGGSPSTVVVDVPEWSKAVEAWGPTSEYQLEVTTDQGETKRFPMDADRNDPWRFELGDGYRAKHVAIVDTAGNTWCAGHFEPAVASGWPDR